MNCQMCSARNRGPHSQHRASRHRRHSDSPDKPVAFQNPNVPRPRTTTMPRTMPTANATQACLSDAPVDSSLPHAVRPLMLRADPGHAAESSHMCHHGHIPCLSFPAWTLHVSGLRKASGRENPDGRVRYAVLVTRWLARDRASEEVQRLMCCTLCFQTSQHSGAPF